ncbi:SLC13 family permease [Candidatus Viridilinea mediisalina]|uniref:SLC13 family permease n=1 Tax=Candidatus Viridilinea mediisalina TaxID=2024553 RepID=A0A2A6RL25_9CHLR|nr:SLC13 family permease [Candidatus Viridilinea mediisalina]PDW03633.1 SLC13 family permease [Candidatus Viridilinea mediisalina]
MTVEILTVFVILGVTIALFISDRLRLDLVALLALLALALTGLLTPAEAAAGFGDTTLLLIAALFVVGEGLMQTGVAASLGRWLGRVAGKSERRILVAMLLLVAPMSAFISSTGAVAIMLPVVVTLAHRSGISPSRLLIPLAYGALIGGMLTLIGTPPNIIASEALVGAGREPLAFFGITPIGLLALLSLTLLLFAGGTRLIPERVAPHVAASAEQTDLSARDLLISYGVRGTLARLRVRPESPLVGSSLVECGLPRRFGALVFASHPWSPERQEPAPARPARADTRIAAGDLLDVQLTNGQLDRLVNELALEPIDLGSKSRLDTELIILEVALTPRSRYIGRSVREIAIRREFGVSVLGIQRLGQKLSDNPMLEPLRFGDTLLVIGAAQALAPLVRAQRYYDDFVIAAVPAALEQQQPGERLSSRAPIAIAITLGMLVIMAAGWLSAMVAALLAAIALVMTGCVRLSDLYQRMSWESLILIGAMLPMATALDKTGGTALIAGGLVDGLGNYGPLALLVGIFLLTAIFSQFISNTATAVLMMPIALASASQLGIAPEPLLVTAAIAASAAFATPIASPVNTIVLKAGGYRFADYARVGVPLQLVVLAICLLVVPWLYPF